MTAEERDPGHHNKFISTGQVDGGPLEEVLAALGSAYRIFPALQKDCNY